MVTVGVDVGGTKIAGGLVDEQGRVLRRAAADTPADSAAAIAAATAELIEKLRADQPDVAAVGIGAAGFIDAARSTVLFAPNLVWRDEPFRSEIADRVGLPVVLENDANAAAWAEYRFGAGRGSRDLVAVTIGTGIGGGLVLDGRLYRGAFGIAGEPGHMRVVPDGRPCGCGNRGCWEQYASGPSLLRAARERSGGEPFPDGRALTLDAQGGDELALACYDEVGAWLGEGLAALAAILDPDRFVVAGGVSEAGDLLLEPARRRYASALSGRAYRPLADIVAAELGPEAGLVGAADLARELACGS